MSATAFGPPLPAVSVLRHAVPYLLLFGAALLLPLTGDRYWSSIAPRACIYWVLVSGLNLVVGYAGQLAIGYVSLLTVGAYVFCILTAKIGLPPIVALLFAGGFGALFGMIV